MAKLESPANRKRPRLKELMLVVHSNDDREDLRGFKYYEEQGVN